MFLDLFSGVDVFFFNFRFLKGFFFLFSFLWIFYTVIFTFFSKLNILFFLENFLFSLFLKGLDDTKGFSLKGWFIVLWGFFYLITLGKLWGLVPYVYGITTNVYIVLFLSFWGWITIIFSRFFTNPFLFTGHFCPAGSPTVLGWFLRLVEVVRVSIRPGTLTLRLVAKMTTGHILIGLLTLASCGLIFSFSILLPFVLLILQGYLIFEVFICLIQGNVFYMLLANYTSEHL